MRASFFILIVLGLWGCQSSPTLPIDDAPTLPTTVDGASDPWIATLQKKLTQQGVQIVTMGQMYLVSIPSTRLFADQSPKLDWNAYDLLNDIVCYLQQFRKITVHVNAYSSCCRSERRTHALTLARSRTIANYLWSQHIESRMVFTQGLGNDKPIVALAACMDSSPNSRIEIRFRRVIA